MSQVMKKLSKMLKTSKFVLRGTSERIFHVTPLTRFDNTLFQQHQTFSLFIVSGYKQNFENAYNLKTITEAL
jgi:hypothetical protein